LGDKKLRIFGPDNNNYININEKKNKLVSQSMKPKNQNIEVEISKDSDIRQKSVEKLKEIDKMERQAKINRLKEEIKSGEYKVDPEELAEIIVDIAM